ncbi:MAG TPA: ABC transporter permease [Vicinamibacterales bacterium]|jgi:ABC-type multidrug transport system permease subunit|nr:ABC transporter permease [Vicinamibacterales bacterium]
MNKPDRGGARHPIVELTLARLREFVREPEALFWTFVFPILMSITMAIAFPSRGVQPVPIGLESGGYAPQTELLRRALQSSPDINLKDLSPEHSRGALREGVVHLVVKPTVPPSYEFDPVRPESRLARFVVDDVLKRASGRNDPWQAEERPIDVPGSRYIDWLIPGLLGVSLMSNGMWGIGFSIVQARMRKLLKRMVASPMRKSEFLLAQLLARLLFLAPEIAIPLLFGVVAFHMPVNGRIVDIAIVSLIGALAFGSLGLLLGSRVKTFEAISGLMNLAMLPMWVLSGVFFSSSNFPDVMQPFIHALPLTELVDALRAVILEGARLPAVAREMTGLILWTVVPFGTALRLFKWR